MESVQAIVRLYICHETTHLIGKYKQGKPLSLVMTFVIKIGERETKSKSTFRGERKFGIKQDKVIRVKFPP